MPQNPRSDAITLCRAISGLILTTLSKAMAVRLRATVVAGGQGFTADDFTADNGKNSDLTPADFVALGSALDALKAVFLDAQGNPTAAYIALVKFADNPTV